MLHHNTQPALIFSRVRIFHLERLEKVTWFHRFGPKLYEDNMDSFHLCLFDFPFIYQFHFLMTTLVKSAFWNPADLLIFKSFQQHSSIISKFVCCGFYIKKDVAFTLISFALLKWHQCLSVQLPFELPVEIPVQLHLEMEVNWLVQNVNELEFDLSRI